MNRITRQPVITAGTIAGIVLAGWQVLVDQGFTSSLTTSAQTSLTVFVGLLVPIVAAIVAARLVTPLASPSLPIGTVINAENADITGIVEPKG